MDKPPLPPPSPGQTGALAFSTAAGDSSPVPLFTAETAAIAGLKGAVARWSRPPEPEAPAIPPPVPITMPEDSPTFASKLLTRTRERINAILDRLNDTTDPREIEQLTRAVKALADLERVLDGRPLPGSRRPSDRPAARIARSALPEPEPTGVPSVPSVPVSPVGIV